jgi:hypothetical protein
VFGRNKQLARQRERKELRVRAEGAMHAGRGVYNSNPWSFALGITGAVFATLYLLARLLGKDDAPKQPTAPDSSYEISVDVE